MSCDSSVCNTAAEGACRPMGPVEQQCTTCKCSRLKAHTSYCVPKRDNSYCLYLSSVGSPIASSLRQGNDNKYGHADGRFRWPTGLWVIFIPTAVSCRAVRSKRGPVCLWSSTAYRPVLHSQPDCKLRSTEPCGGYLSPVICTGRFLAMRLRECQPDLQLFTDNCRACS